MSNPDVSLVDLINVQKPADCPPVLSDLIYAMCRKNPTERPTMKYVVDTLAALKDGKEPPRPSSRGGAVEEKKGEQKRALCVCAFARTFLVKKL